MMSTHQMHTVETMADRMLMISRGKRVLYGKVDEVRQQYAKNAIVVQGTGDWNALLGVHHVETNARDEVVLHLEDGTTPDAVMARLANESGYSIRRFELAIPGLDEIFIEVASGNGNA